MTQKLIDTNPYNEKVTLSDGTVVQMPFHVFEGTTAQILGIVDYEQACKFVNNHDFEPIRLPGLENKAIGVFLLQHINNSTAGPYNETVNMFFVQRKGSTLPPVDPISNPNNPSEILGAISTISNLTDTANEVSRSEGRLADYGLYVQFLELDNQLAVDAGLEIWGYPKVLSQIVVTLTDEIFSFDIRDEAGGRPVLSISYKRDFSLPVTVNSPTEHIMPDNYHPHADRHPHVSGMVATLPDSEAHIMDFSGHFRVGNSRSLTANALRKTNFQPIGVLELTKFQAFIEHCALKGKTTKSLET